jgi:hypothetical protein
VRASAMIQRSRLVAREREVDGRPGSTLQRPVSGPLRTSCQPGPMARTSQLLSNSNIKHPCRRAFGHSCQSARRLSTSS